MPAPAKWAGYQGWTGCYPPLMGAGRVWGELTCVWGHGHGMWGYDHGIGGMVVVCGGMAWTCGGVLSLPSAAFWVCRMVVLGGFCHDLGPKMAEVAIRPVLLQCTGASRGRVKACSRNCIAN